MYFKTSLDNDVNFLIDNMGVDIKINNQEAKALLKNINNTTDDKQIITNSELSRGDYVEYVDAFFIAKNDVVDKRYNLYYKNIIQKCNHSIKFVIDGKVEEFYTILEGQKFSIVGEQFFNFVDDKIIVTLQAGDITNKITKNMRFIKLNSAWKIVGIDKTKKGLIILYADVDLIDSNVDDLEEEIADYNLIEDIEDDPEEPEPDEPDEPEFYIIITGADKTDMTKDEIYIAKVYDENDEYIYKPVTFSVDDTSLAIIKNQSNNQCELAANMNFNIGYVTLRATLVEDENIFGEKVIGINQI